jgi:hypothetical protein
MTLTALLESLIVNPYDDGSLWVLCDRCQKWRRVPAYVDSALLPHKW